jgi:CRISPR-associated protein Csn2
MKLVYPGIETHIILEQGKPTFLILENAKLFREVVQDIFNQVNGIEGKAVLSDEDEIIPLNKQIDLILDLFSLNCNSHKMLSKLQGELAQVAVGEELYKDTSDLLSKLQMYAGTLADNAKYPLKFNEEMGIVELVKLLNFKFDLQDESILEKIVSYMIVSKEYLKIDTFVFINLQSVITSAELKELFKQIAYEKITILLIESVSRDKIMDECRIIIDNDLCEIN